MVIKRENLQKKWKGVCSRTFILFWLMKTSVRVKQIKFPWALLFFCLFRPFIHIFIFGMSFPFLFLFFHFALSILWYFPFPYGNIYSWYLKLNIRAIQTLTSVSHLECPYMSRYQLSNTTLWLAKSQQYPSNQDQYSLYTFHSRSSPLKALLHASSSAPKQTSNNNESNA